MSGVPSYPNLPAMFLNMRQAFAAPASTPQDAARAASDAGPEPTEPEHTAHMPENKEGQEVRLALAPIHDAIEQLTAVGALIGRSLENVKRIYDAPIYEPATLSVTNHPYVIADHQRNHVAVFVAATQTLSLMIPGVGSGIAYTLAAGWNQLDFPPLSEISVATGGASFNGLFLYSMDRIANA